MLPSGTQAQLTVPHRPKPQPLGSFPSPPYPRLVPAKFPRTWHRQSPADWAAGS